MTVNPIAAVGGPAAPGGAAAAESVAAAHAAGQAERAAPAFAQQIEVQPRGPGVEALRPEAQSRFLANPATLGERVLNHLEGFHRRAGEVRAMAESPAGAADPGAPGPASRHPGAGPAADGAQARIDQVLDTIVHLYDFAVETQLVVKSGTQVTSTVNTLLKGQ